MYYSKGGPSSVTTIIVAALLLILPAPTLLSPAPALGEREVYQDQSQSPQQSSQQKTTSSSQSSSSQSSKKDTTPYIKLPATRTAKPNRYFCLKPDTNCTSIKWIIPSGLDTIDPEIPIKDANVTVLIGDTPGTYIIQCYGALNGQASDLASCTVTIGSPPGPGPGPGPGPNPPPVPDPLTQSLQTAYTQDADPTKADLAKALAALYQQASTTTVNDTTLKTTADLLAVMVQARSQLMPATAIINTRKAIETYLNTTLGATSVPLDAATRTKASTAFAAIATSLGKVK